MEERSEQIAERKEVGQEADPRYAMGKRGPVTATKTTSQTRLIVEMMDAAQTASRQSGR